MSKKVVDAFQPKISRSDRFAQMSHQEKVIEQKKKEIQAKLEAAKLKGSTSTAASSANSSSSDTSGNEPKNTEKNTSSNNAPETKSSAGVNIFSNDGSFLDQFKQMKDKRIESKLKSFRNKDLHMHNRSDKNRWSPRRRSTSPNKDQRVQKPRVSRFDRSPNFDSKITINTNFVGNNNSSNNPNVNLTNFETLQPPPVNSQNVTGQPLMKNNFPPTCENSVLPPPVLLNVPPPQIVQNPVILQTLPPNLQMQNNLMQSNANLVQNNTNLIASNANLTNLIPNNQNLLQTNPNLIPNNNIIANSSNLIASGANLLSNSNLIGNESLLSNNTNLIGNNASLLSNNSNLIQNNSNLISNMSLIQNSQNLIPNSTNLIGSNSNLISNIANNQNLLQNSAVMSNGSNLLNPNANLIQSSQVLTTVTLPPPTIISASNNNVAALPVPPPCIQTVELSTIPPPNPIQVQNIPPPDPINAINIPPPAPLQVHNIPTPTSLQLNEIPNPKPLDILAIPTPAENKISNADFIKNVPPPNKSIPPPNIEFINQNTTGLVVPPPQTNLILSQSASNSQFVTTVTLPLTGASPVTPLIAASLPPPTINVNCPPPMILPPNNIPPPVLTAAPPSQIPPMNVPPPAAPPPSTSAANLKDATVFPPGSPDYEAMASLAKMVAQCGTSIEDVVRQRKNQDPSHWFLFRKESAAYQQYLQLIEQFRNEMDAENGASGNGNSSKYKPDDIYEPEMAIMADDDVRVEIKEENESGSKRKRKSRWGDKEPTVAPPTVLMYPQTGGPAKPPSGNVMLSKVTRTDPGLIQYVINTFGSTNVTEEEWKKAEDHYKINLLYQDMMRKRQEVEKLRLAGKNKYDYDSDEETEGGTWEHKLRDKEMVATQSWAQELTRQAEGKHHIGDFLPPEELKRFLEKSQAAKEGRQPTFSDYKEFKIKEDNIGFKMLQKLGWSEGEGLGSCGAGIVDPVNKASARDGNEGLGANQIEENEDEYESYRKRMMLAYRFRPNPLNNPRRPYY